MLDTNRFEEFISQYPIYEYRVLDAAEIQVRERVRTICKQECERYGTTWACPPAVGTLEECAARIHSYKSGIFFSSVAEVSDLMNMEEMLSTRDAHEQLTCEVAEFLKGEGFRDLYPFHRILRPVRTLRLLRRQALPFPGKNAPLPGKPRRSRQRAGRETFHGIQSWRKHHTLVFPGTFPVKKIMIVKNNSSV